MKGIVKMGIIVLVGIALLAIFGTTQDKQQPTQNGLNNANVNVYKVSTNWVSRHDKCEVPYENGVQNPRYFDNVMYYALCSGGSPRCHLTSVNLGTRLQYDHGLFYCNSQQDITLPLPHGNYEFTFACGDKFIKTNLNCSQT